MYALRPRLKFLRFRKRLLRTAIKLLKKGHSIIPCNGKRALVQWKLYQMEPMSIEEMRRVFAEQEVTGIAIITIDFAIRDFDTEESYKKWAKANPKLAALLPTVKSKKGYHVYCVVPENFRVFRKYDDGEFRGTRAQYTLMPPSAYFSDTGKVAGEYEWIIPIPNDGIPFVKNPVKAGLVSACPKKPHKKAIKHNTHTSLSSTYIGVQSDRIAESSNADDSEERVSAAFWVAFRTIENRARLHRARKQGERNFKIMRYVRSIKGLMTEPLWTEWHQWTAFLIWWKESKRNVKTKNVVTSWMEFRSAFKNCVAWETKLDMKRLIACAVEEPLHPGAIRLHKNGRQLAKVFSYLDRHHEGRKIPLTYKDMARGFELTEVWARKMVERLIKNGVLKRLSSGNNFKGLASTYRYLRISATACDNEKKKEYRHESNYGQVG